MTFTVLVTALPCNHILLSYTTSTGKTGQIMTSRPEFLEEIAEINLHDRAMLSLHSFVKERRAAGDTWAQVKTAVEAKVFTI